MTASQAQLEWAKARLEYRKAIKDLSGWPVEFAPEPGRTLANNAIDRLDAAEAAWCEAIVAEGDRPVFDKIMVKDVLVDTPTHNVTFGFVSTSTSVKQGEA